MSRLLSLASFLLLLLLICAEGASSSVASIASAKFQHSSRFFLHIHDV